jgi:hypothetical protein
MTHTEDTWIEDIKLRKVFDRYLVKNGITDFSLTTFQWDCIQDFILSQKAVWTAEERHRILPHLHQIWASIPLTQGKVARKMIKELIDALK